MPDICCMNCPPIPRSKRFKWLERSRQSSTSLREILDMRSTAMALLIDLYSSWTIGSSCERPLPRYRRRADSASSSRSRSRSQRGLSGTRNRKEQRKHAGNSCDGVNQTGSRRFAEPGVVVQDSRLTCRANGIRHCASPSAYDVPSVSQLPSM